MTATLTTERVFEDGSNCDGCYHFRWGYGGLGLPECRILTGEVDAECPALADTPTPEETTPGTIDINLTLSDVDVYFEVCEETPTFDLYDYDGESVHIRLADLPELISLMQRVAPKSELQIEGSRLDALGDLRESCLSNYMGGYQGDEYKVFRHGMETVCNVVAAALKREGSDGV